MSKKNIFISAALTIFVLVVLANVITVYAKIRDAVTSRSTTQPIAAGATVVPAQNQVAYQEAASIAANYLGQSDLYSAENTVWNGVDAYKIVFSSGYAVYVSLDGQVLGSEAPQPVFISAPAQNGNINQSAFTNSSSHTEDHDNHEKHEEHDHH
jgi:hypothetical protein